MRKIIFLAFALAAFSATAFSCDRHIVSERNDAVYVANLDGGSERKIADGILPAISPEGMRVALNTVELARKKPPCIRCRSTEKI